MQWDVAAIPHSFAPAFVAVVVPAHNEAKRIARSVRALQRALASLDLVGLESAIVVVSDASTDTTAERAAGALGRFGSVIEVDYRNVGAARRAGFDRVRKAASGLPGRDVWIATTDADTIVRPDWLSRQLNWWRAGADAVAGTVVPAAWSEHSVDTRSRYEAHMRALGTGHGHPHVYGANLGTTMDTYQAAGGMPTLQTGEDHAFWRAAQSAGRNAVSVGDVVVTTSSRRGGRAPMGFASLLRSFEMPGATR